MSARAESVTYEVRLEIDEAIAADVDTWLPEHVHEMLRQPGFIAAHIYDDAPLPVPADGKVRRTVQYQVESSEALTTYLREQAPRLREDGVRRFGERMRATRRVLQAVDDARTGEVRVCSNCHAALNGQYCALCGQRDRNRMISLWELVSDFTDEFFDVDSRFWRTLFQLLFRPGQLTREYLRGRRVHYTPPLRLYLLSSVLFFLLATFGGISGGIRVDGDAEGPFAPDEILTPDALPPEVPPEEAEKAAAAVKAAAEAAERADRVSGLMIGKEKCTLGDFSTGNAFLDGPVRARLQLACEHIVADNGRGFVRQLVNNIPTMLLVFLPVLAFAMKPLHLGSRRYYVEHLLFFVHFHSFVFAVLVLTLITTRIKDHYPGFALANGLVVAAISVYIPYYLFRALRVVYGQGRVLTMFKYVLLLLIYLIGLSATFAVGVLFTALTV